MWQRGHPLVLQRGLKGGVSSLKLIQSELFSAKCKGSFTFIVTISQSVFCLLIGENSELLRNK